MRRLHLPAVLCAVMALTACRTTPPAPPKTPIHMAKQFELTTQQTHSVQYLLYLPKGYEASQDRKWPVILFLHGAGERGNDVWKAATHGPPKLVTDQPDFPFVIVTPLCPSGQRWSSDLLLALLDEVTKSHAIDTTRLYLTGLSMGGYGTWNLGLAHPEKFAAIAPICGGGQIIDVLLASRDRAQALKSLPVWAFHGAKDAVVPLEESERMVNALKKAGCQEVRFTVYPEAQHNSWTETYNNPALYDWFLQHQRTPQGQ